MNFHAFKRFIDLAPASAAAQPVIQVEEQNSDYESGVARVGTEQWANPHRPDHIGEARCLRRGLEARRRWIDQAVHG